MSFKKLLFVLIFVHAGLLADAQQDSLVARLDAWRNTTLQENLYAHIDRSFFLTGETLWFNLFYFDETFHLPLDISKVAYAEVLDKDRKSVLNVKILLNKGGGHGSFFLPSSLASGNYLFRAYTSLMKNYSADLFFEQGITIVNPFTRLGLTEPLAAPKYDAQFFPEGGNLVEGIQSKVGFRVVNASGKGVAFRGSIVTESHDTVARFAPHRFGIGSFDFRPSAGHSYTAIIHDGKNTVTRIAMPAAAHEGYVINAYDTADGKTKIVVRSNVESLSTEPFCYLLIHTRTAAIQSKRVYLSSGEGVFVLDRSSLGQGVSHVTLFTAGLIPVAERLVFKQPKIYALEIHPDQSLYGKRKKVSIDLNSQGSSRLSLSVFKDDSLQAKDRSDIASWLWLTSELKGAIESPEYYLSGTDEARLAADNLMLTHGWSRFTWGDVMSKRNKVLEFTPEYRGHIIAGRVKNLAPADQRKVIVYLSNPDKNIRLYPSRSTLDGKVQFELREFYGPRKLIAQTNIRVDSIYDLEILSPFSTKYSAHQYPPFDFSKDLGSSITERSLHMQVQNTFHDVNRDRFHTEQFDTTAFYGIPDEQYYLDDYTRFPTMEEVMREYIMGVRVRNRKGNFHFGVLDNINRKVFRDDPLVLLDGVPVFDINKIIAMDPLKIKKCEVMTRKYYLGPKAFDGIVSFTTYHGDLSDFVMDRRTLIQDYEGLQIYREFFSPRYETDQTRKDRVPDARTLLYWNPNITTGADGKQNVSFYTSDIAGKFNIIVQSLSADGNPATASTVVEVK